MNTLRHFVILNIARFNRIKRKPLSEILTFVIKRSKVLIVHLKDRIPIVIWNKLFDELLLWEDYGLNSYWLLGNHDFQTDRTIDLLRVFKHAKPIISPTNLIVEETNIHLLPYGQKYDPKFFTKETREILLVHDFFQELDYKFKTTGLKLKTLKKDYNLIFAGHYHFFREIEHEKAYHLGSTHQTNFSEVNEKKFFAVVNDDQFDFIEFKHPELIQFNYTEKDKFDVKGKYLKVVIEIKSLSKYNAKKIKQEFLDLGALGVKVEMKYISQVKKRLQTDKELTTLSDEEVIDNFINERADELDREILLTISNKIMK